MDRRLQKLKFDMRALLQSAGRQGLTLEEVERDYMDLFRVPIPYAEYGATSTRELLANMRDVILIMDGSTTGLDTLYFPVSHQSTRHLEDLIDRQRVHSPTRFGGTVSAALQDNDGRGNGNRNQNQNRNQTRNFQIATPAVVINVPLPPTDVQQQQRMPAASVRALVPPPTSVPPATVAPPGYRTGPGFSTVVRPDVNRSENVEVPLSLRDRIAQRMQSMTNDDGGTSAQQIEPPRAVSSPLAQVLAQQGDYQPSTKSKYENKPNPREHAVDSFFDYNTMTYQPTPTFENRARPPPPPFGVQDQSSGLRFATDRQMSREDEANEILRRLHRVNIQKENAPPPAQAQALPIREPIAQVPPIPIPMPRPRPKAPSSNTASSGAEATASAAAAASGAVASGGGGVRQRHDSGSSVAASSIMTRLPDFPEEAPIILPSQLPAGVKMPPPFWETIYSILREHGNGNEWMDVRQFQTEYARRTRKPLSADYLLKTCGIKSYKQLFVDLPHVDVKHSPDEVMYVRLMAPSFARKNVSMYDVRPRYKSTKSSTAGGVAVPRDAYASELAAEDEQSLLIPAPPTATSAFSNPKEKDPALSIPHDLRSQIYHLLWHQYKGGCDISTFSEAFTKRYGSSLNTNRDCGMPLVRALHYMGDIVDVGLAPDGKTWLRPVDYEQVRGLYRAQKRRKKERERQRGERMSAAAKQEEWDDDDYFYPSK